MTMGTRAILFGVLFLGMLGGATFVLFRFLVRTVLSTLSDDFPSQTVLELAERRSDERMAIGIMNVKVSITRDSDHIHVEPEGWYARFGARPFSLPHAAYELLGPRQGDRVQLRLGRSAVWGPAWCFEADQDNPETLGE